MASLQTNDNFYQNSSPIQSYSIPTELIYEKKKPKSSILKKKGIHNEFKTQSMEEEQISQTVEEKKKKVKLSFQTPIHKTYDVENWKEYNFDASKDDELCICNIF